jgi:hypothetical protein
MIRRYKIQFVDRFNGEFFPVDDENPPYYRWSEEDAIKFAKEKLDAWMNPDDKLAFMRKSNSIFIHIWPQDGGGPIDIFALITW